MGHQVWFTADPHFGHPNMCLGGPRPFDKARPFRTVQEMDDALVANWNKLVKAEDEVYVVGDFCLSNLPKAAGSFARLNGWIHVIPGSHDQRWFDAARKQQAKGEPHYPVKLVSASGSPIILLPELVTIRLPQYKVNGKTLTMTMCHYQMASWEQSHHGTLHIFGHHHGQRQGIGRSMDVGVDTNRLQPYGMKPLVEHLLKKPIHGKYALAELEN